MVSAYEIDFLPVGEGERSGDAIAIRWFESDGQRVMIYDGGTREYGKVLVDHVKKHFKTDLVHYVVNSHPDNDHAGGLEYVLDNIRVAQVWMHKPWDYSQAIRHYFDGRITDNSLKERLQKKMAAAHAVQKAAERHGVPVYEPFAGCQIGIFTVLSPERERYIHELVPEFEKSPDLKKSAATATMEALHSVFDSMQGAIGYVAARWHEEFLPDNVSTSAENESSVILYAKTEQDGILLTGDAGIDSLKAAAEYARMRGANLPEHVTFVQIPHHGGRHNVSTVALDLIVGPAIAEQPGETRKRAYVSAAKEAPRHPKRVVTNAFNRRGFKVVQTKGQPIWRNVNVEKREGYGPITFVPFYNQVEE